MGSTVEPFGEVPRRRRLVDGRLEAGADAPRVQRDEAIERHRLVRLELRRERRARQLRHLVRSHGPARPRRHVHRELRLRAGRRLERQRRLRVGRPGVGDRQPRVHLVGLDALGQVAREGRRSRARLRRAAVVGEAARLGRRQPASRCRPRCHGPGGRPPGVTAVSSRRAASPRPWSLPRRRSSVMSPAREAGAGHRDRRAARDRARGGRERRDGRRCRRSVV